MLSPRTALRARQAANGRSTNAGRGLIRAGPAAEEGATRFWVPLARFGWAIGLTATTLYAMRWIERADDLTAVPLSLIVLLALLTTAFSGIYLGVAAVILACAGTAYFVIPPDDSFSAADRSQWFRLLTSGAIALIVAVLYETLRRQSQRAEELSRRLAEANRAKDEFIGQVSHELRTPLTVIVGNASILLREQNRLDRTERRLTLEDILDSGERLQHMIDNLIALARAEAKAEAPDEPILVHRVLGDLIERHRRRTPEHQINLFVSPDLPPLICSRESLEEVVDNLLSNAEKYSPTTEPVDVRIQLEQRVLAVSVADRGPGFGGANIAELFEPFARSDSARLAAPGLGIGLSVAQRLVQAHGGRIWAQNREGGGAEVTFSLPVRVVANENDLVVDALVSDEGIERTQNGSQPVGQNHHVPR